MKHQQPYLHNQNFIPTRRTEVVEKKKKKKKNNNNYNSEKA